MALFQLFLRRREYTGELGAPVILSVKTSSFGLTGVPYLAPSILVVKIAILRLLSVRVDLSKRVQVKIGSLTLRGVLSTTVGRLNVKESSLGVLGVRLPLSTRLDIKTPDIKLLGVKVTPVVAVNCKVSNIGISGVKTTASKIYNVKTPTLTILGVRSKNLSFVSVNTPSLALTGVKLPTVVRLDVYTASAPLQGVKVKVFKELDGGGSPGDLRMYYSGTTNYGPDYYQYLSLGGAISSSVVGSNRPSVSTLTGVTILDAYGNTIGINGYWSPVTLTFTLGSPNTYQWGSSLPIEVPAEGFYTLGDVDTGQAYIYVDGTFPTADTSEDIQVARGRHTMFDIQSPYYSYHGKTDYRCFYVVNDSVSKSIDVGLWIESQPAIGSVLAVGLDLAGIGDGVVTGVAQSISDDRTAPTGVGFSTPTIGSPLMIGSLSQQEVRAIWVRRILTGEIKPLTFFNESWIKIGGFI